MTFWRVTQFKTAQSDGQQDVLNTMENNSVKSLFIWAPNSKKTGRFLFELKTGLFHSLEKEEKGVKPSHWGRFKVSPLNHWQLRRQMRFPQPGASCCLAYALRDPRHRCGGSPGRAPEASRAAHQGSQGSHSSKRFKSKNMWKKKITTSEKQELHSLPNRRATCNTFHLKTSCKFSLITGTKSRSRGRAVVSADGG